MPPRFFIVGTKYGRSEDVFPQMERDSVVCTGFATGENLAAFVGKRTNEIRKSLMVKLPRESSHARNTLSLLLSMRPGDIVAVKSHSAPRHTEPRLVIVRYAVVAGRSKARYIASEELGHSIEVEFFERMEPIELAFGYGHTIHEVVDETRIEQIFFPYSAVSSIPTAARVMGDRATHETVVHPRREYLMTRVHNELQNALRTRLVELYGASAVTQEEDNVDLTVSLPGRLTLIEVKSSPSPITCIREALGQILLYGWRKRSHLPIDYLVVGPKAATLPDAEFISHLRKAVGLNIHYCTPRDYQP